MVREGIAAAAKSITVTVPTPAGPQVVQVSDPASRRAVLEAYKPREPGPLEKAAAAVPGGVATIAIGAVLLAVLLGRRRG